MGRKTVTIDPQKGERLKQLLQEYSVSQKEIAAVLHYSPEQISYIINGKRNLTEPAAKEIIKYFNSINVNKAKQQASIIEKEMLEQKTISFAWQSNIQPKTIRFEWLMGYDDFKTEQDYAAFRKTAIAEDWKQSWDKVLTEQRYRKDTADRAFDLFLSMYNKKFDEMFFEQPSYFEWPDITEYHDRFSNIAILYRDMFKDRSRSFEGGSVFCYIKEFDKSSDAIPCLAEDYIAAINKVSDYARLVINDLITTSKEKAKEREKAKLEEADTQEEAEEDEHNG